VIAFWVAQYKASSAIEVDDSVAAHCAAHTSAWRLMTQSRITGPSVAGRGPCKDTANRSSLGPPARFQARPHYWDQSGGLTSGQSWRWRAIIEFRGEGPIGFTPCLCQRGTCGAFKSLRRRSGLAGPRTTLKTFRLNRAGHRRRQQVAGSRKCAVHHPQYCQAHQRAASAGSLQTP